MQRIKARAALVTFLFALPVGATDYYVAVNGNDGNSGMVATQPFATLGRAQTAAMPGDTVFVGGGVYTFTSGPAVGVLFSKSGQQDMRINYFAAPGEQPIFDFFGLTPQSRVTGFHMTGSWIHLRGLEIRGVQQVIVGDSWGIRIQGSNNIVENVTVHHGEAPGIFIAGGANNQILNCDSHHNYDPLEAGGNADGFGCHTTGAGNIFSGCRSFSNSDDGFDFINCPGACTVEKSWAFSNGYVPDTLTAAGNGAGIKAGGFGLDQTAFPAVVPRHVVRFNVAFGNRSQGFYANHHPGGIDFLNNTAFRNSRNFDMLADVRASNHTLRNNVALMPGSALANLNGGTDSFNSWSLPVTVSSADFLSVAEAQALGPRGADGSLPNVTFMHLATGSDLIDKGENVGFPYAGSAPDLGAFESGLPSGAGGMGGVAGAAGSAGVPTGGTAGAAAGGTSSGAAGSSATAGAGASPATGGASGSFAGGTLGDSSADAHDASCGCRVATGQKAVASSALFSLLAFAALLRRRPSRMVMPGVRIARSALYSRSRGLLVSTARDLGLVERSAR